MSVREFIADDWPARLAQAGLPNLGVLLDEVSPAGRLPGQWQALTKPGLGGRERWRWEWPSADGPTVLYVKRYLHTPPAAQLDRIRRQTARHSRAWWEFRQSLELGRKSIHVVRAVAAVEDMAGLVERRSAVLFEALPGEALERLWPAACAETWPLTRGVARQAAIRRLAQFVSAFHQSGACHRDLYLCHIFAQLDADAERQPQFALLDLARVHYPRMRRMRWIIKDLSQVDCSARQCGASRADRLRFLVTYLGLHARTPRVRWYARRIVRKSDGILWRIARKSGGS